MKKDEQFTEWAMKILSIAQAGLSYSDNPFEIERCHELQKIGEQMLSWQMDQPLSGIKRLFDCEDGYMTPKVDTRAALFEDGKILLVHENNGDWALPGGWCETTCSPVENTLKELEEEAGVIGRAEKLIAVQDWRKHNPCNLPYGVVKIFIECSPEGKTEMDHTETSEARFFSRDEIPENLASEKDTKEQIEMCFDAYEAGKNWQVQFD